MIRTRVGYAGGTTADPTYQNIGDHTETFEVDFDPNVITYEELLAIFWESHDPTFASTLRQYGKVIFYHDERQRLAAEASRDAIAAELGEQVMTLIEPLGTFTRAEDYHQKYYLRHSRAVYDEISACFSSERDFADSTAAARLNGYVGGHGTLEQFERERDLLGLSDDALAVVQEAVETAEGKCDAE